MRFSSAARVIDEAIRDRAFPAAVVEVGGAGQPLWRQAFGRLTFDPAAPATADDTIFDLASLTKVLATTPLLMQQVERGALGLDDPVSRYVEPWTGSDRADVTLRDLLSHAGGLTAYVPFYRDHQGRAAFERAISATPLAYTPRTQAIYSDLGFMLLGFLLDDEVPLATRFTTLLTQMGIVQEVQFNQLAAALSEEPLAFNPPREWRDRTAPTEVDTWRGRLLTGEVHDENAWALGGVAGHAGLFGTAAAVGAFAQAVLRTIAGEGILASPPTMDEFIARIDVPGSSRALGWDTMLPTSSCGTRLSPTAIGHTGFTGTSLWIDWERDRYIVLLTNRVNPTRESTALRQLRPQIHDAIADAMF